MEWLHFSLRSWIMVFLVVLFVTLAILLFIARRINSVKNTLTVDEFLLEVGTLIVGIMLGSFNPFAVDLQFYGWDRFFPTIPQVTASPMSAPVISRTGDTINIPTAPPGYKAQVTYIDIDGTPQFETTEKVTYELPEGAKKPSVRYLRGNRVTEWTAVPDATVPPVVPPAPVPAPTPTPPAPIT